MAPANATMFEAIAAKRMAFVAALVAGDAKLCQFAEVNRSMCGTRGDVSLALYEAVCPTCGDLRADGQGDAGRQRAREAVLAHGGTVFDFD